MKESSVAVPATNYMAVCKRVIMCSVNRRAASSNDAYDVAHFPWPAVLCLCFVRNLLFYCTRFVTNTAQHERAMLSHMADAFLVDVCAAHCVLNKRRLFSKGT